MWVAPTCTYLTGLCPLSEVCLNIHTYMHTYIHIRFTDPIFVISALNMKEANRYKSHNTQMDKTQQKHLTGNKEYSMLYTFSLNSRVQ
jgi:hypothetical protein